MSLPYKYHDNDKQQKGITNGVVALILKDAFERVNDSVWAHYRDCGGETSLITNWWFGIKGLVFPRPLDFYHGQFLGQSFKEPVLDPSPMTTRKAPSVSKKNTATISKPQSSTRRHVATTSNPMPGKWPLSFYPSFVVLIHFSDMGFGIFPYANSNHDDQPIIFHRRKRSVVEEVPTLPTVTKTSLLVAIDRPPTKSKVFLSFTCFFAGPNCYLWRHVPDYWRRTLVDKDLNSLFFTYSTTTPLLVRWSSGSVLYLPRPLVDSSPFLLRIRKIWRCLSRGYITDPIHLTVTRSLAFRLASSSDLSKNQRSAFRQIDFRLPEISSRFSTALAAQNTAQQALDELAAWQANMRVHANTYLEMEAEQRRIMAE